VATIRSLIDRIFPRGALVLSVLSFAYFIAGIVRNRIFANTYGVGPELDAYNAAFRIPEIALDVLVAAGLTAPFVPIYTALRHDDGRAADTFGRTVLTGAVLVMLIAVLLILLAAPWLAATIGAGFDAETQELYIDLLRINCLAQILFAASICIGEVLVAHRGSCSTGWRRSCTRPGSSAARSSDVLRTWASWPRPGARSSAPCCTWASAASASCERASAHGRPSGFAPPRSGSSSG
jgi:hypothetical protein